MEVVFDSPMVSINKQVASVVGKSAAVEEYPAV